MTKIPDWQDYKNPRAALAFDALDNVSDYIDGEDEERKMQASYMIGCLADRYGLSIAIVDGKVMVTLALPERA